MSIKVFKRVARYTLPSSIRQWLKTQLYIHRHHPPLGKVRMGDMKGLQPISTGWGFDRGQPVDRYYIENFLASHSNDIHGRVLAIGDAFYTRKFGGDRVVHSDVLHIENNPNATIVADLTDAAHIPSDTFDCFLLIQTLQLIYEVRLALKTTYRIMKPGGIVLATFPGITPLKDEEWNSCWCWNFTPLSARRLFEEFFPPENIHIHTHGNVLAATAFLQGLSVQDILPQEKLDFLDLSFPVTITVRAMKPEQSP